MITVTQFSRFIKIGLPLLLVTWGAAASEALTEEEGLELRRTPVVKVFEKAKDAVVNISCTQVVERNPGVNDLFENFFDWRFRLHPDHRRYAITSVGSGFLVHPDGYVVTNAHVVMKTVDQRVIFADGTEYKARPVSIDSTSDLAVLKIDTKKPLKALPLGRSNDLMIGETVVAIGNPLGYHNTLTTGVISALNRTLEFDQGVKYEGLIQTDASINPGNSGGPLLNILGELIGVNTAIRGDAQNIGFAIPVDSLRKTLPGMLSLERLKRVRVGMRVRGQGKVYVTEVQKGSPAQRSGIQAGDRLVSVDGMPVTQDLKYYFHLLSKGANDRIHVELERGSRTIRALVKLSAIPIPDGKKLILDKFGLQIEPLPLDLTRSLGLEGGLIVRKVQQATSARQAGIQPGMIIVTIAGDFPRDLDHVGLLLEDVQSGDVVVFTIWDVERYGGRLLIRPYEIPLRAK